MTDVLKLLLVAALFAYLGLILVALWVAPRMIFPRRSGISDPDREGLRITAIDGLNIAARFLPHPDADRLLLYHHGNAEDLAELDERLGWYRDHGFAVLAYDYPGYGTSEGTPTSRSVLAAAESVLAYARDTLGWNLGSIVSYGRSLGGGPCLALAAHHTLAGAVVEATFTSTFRVVTRWRLLPWDVFDNLTLISQARCPVLIVHGRQDMTVPFSHAEQLMAAAPEGTRHLWIDTANHVDVVEAGGETYWTTLREFAHANALSQGSRI